MYKYVLLTIPMCVSLALFFVIMRGKYLLVLSEKESVVLAWKMV